MSVASLCNPNVATIGADASPIDAAKRMREAHVGDLVVTERKDGVEAPVGIVTDRDLVVEVLAQDVDPAAVRVGDIMSGRLVTVREDNGLEHALQTMHRHGLRRLPVVDGRDALVGLLSLDDVIAYLARLTGHIGDALRIEQETEARLRA